MPKLAFKNYEIDPWSKQENKWYSHAEQSMVENVIASDPVIPGGWYQVMVAHWYIICLRIW